MKTLIRHAATAVMWILAGGNSLLMLVGAVAILIADILFSANVLGDGYGLHMGLLMSLAVSGMLVATQAFIGFGDDKDLSNAWRTSAKWQKAAFLLSFLVRFVDAYLSSLYADLNMAPMGEVDGIAYWLSKVLIFVIDFAGEMIAPAIVLLLLKQERE